ncbi:hypothetical protein FHG87_022988 [Trinorchestia longiramus]|nr:hypothetical protein FHG87_022988 [Trinorchestia longiramus]
MADALKNSNPFVENNSKHIRLNFKNLHENESREDTDGIVGVNGNCEIKKDNFSSNEIGVVKSGFQNTLPGENQPKNSYSGISGDSRIPVGDSSDSGHDSHGLDDDDDDGDGSNGGDDDGDDGSPKTDNGDLKVKKFGDGAIKSEKNENFSPASDIEMIKEAMKNVKLTSKTGTQKNVETTNRNTGINRRTASVEKSNRGSNRTVDTNSSNDSKNCNNDNINNSSNSIINSSNDNSRNRNNSYNSNSTNASRNVICNTTDDVNATGARMLNSTNSCTDSTNRHNDNSTKRHDDNITKRHDDNSTQRHNDNSTNKHDDNSTNRHDNSTQRHDDNSTNKHDDNSTQRHDDNSTNRHDDNSRYFTIIQDSSKDSSCKRCPQLNASCKQWSKLLEKLVFLWCYPGHLIINHYLWQRDADICGVLQVIS